jgi:hypothetical protein
MMLLQQKLCVRSFSRQKNCEKGLRSVANREALDSPMDSPMDSLPTIVELS